MKLLFTCNDVKREVAKRLTLQVCIGSTSSPTFHSGYSNISSQDFHTLKLTNDELFPCSDSRLATDAIFIQLKLTFSTKIKCNEREVSK